MHEVAVSSTLSRMSPSKSSSRWSLYFGIVLIGANLRAPITSLGPVLPDIQRTLHLGGFGAGVLNALPLFMFAVLSLVAPPLGKRYGLERILGWAILAIGIGTLVRSLDLPGGIWLGTVVLSTGIAFGNVLLPGMVKREFHDKAAGLIGLYAAAMAGVAGLASGLAVPISSLPGADWTWSIGCWAILALVTFMCWLPHWRAGPTPEMAAHSARTTLSPWKHPIGWQVSLFFAMHSFVFYSLIDWYASYASAKGIGLKIAGGYLLIYQIVAIATNLGSAPIIRRSRDQKALGFVCGLLLLVGCAGLLWLPGLSLLWLVSAGLGAGIAMVTSLSLFGLRTHDHHQAAALSGMAQFIGYLGAAAGPLLIGLLHQVTGGWAGAMALLSVASVLVILFATLAGRHRFIGD